MIKGGVTLKKAERHANKLESNNLLKLG